MSITFRGFGRVFSHQNRLSCLLTAQSVNVVIALHRGLEISNFSPFTCLGESMAPLKENALENELQLV